MKLIIDRSIWYRGRGSRGSRLLRLQDGRRCCLGIYLGALGVADEALNDTPTPDTLDVHVIKNMPAAMWLFDWAHNSDLRTVRGVSPLLSLLCKRLLTVNDDSHIAERQREDRVQRLFATAGITVTFTGGTPDAAARVQ